MFTEQTQCLLNILIGTKYKKYQTLETIEFMIGFLSCLSDYNVQQLLDKNTIRESENKEETDNFVILMSVDHIKVLLLAVCMLSGKRESVYCSRMGI